MFEQSGAGSPGAGSPERLARFQAGLEQSLNDHEGLLSVTEESTGWVGRVQAAERAQNRAAAAQLVAIGGLFAYRLSRCSETEEWAADTMDAVAAEVGAALRISKGRAHNRVQDARMMRERLPQVSAVFQAGDIDLQAFRVIALRTDLIEDRQVLAKVDGLIAANIGRWPSLTRGKLAAKVDAIVARRDLDAVHRRTDHQADRDVSITDEGDGLSRIDATVTTVDARAFDQRLRTLVAKLCPHDPRSPGPDVSLAGV